MAKIKARHHENYGSYTLMAWIVPLAGFIMGAAFMTKDDILDKKFGEHLVATGLISTILGGLFFLLFIAPLLFVW